MTQASLRALADRAVACKAWRWLPGSVDEDGYRVTGTYTDIEGGFLQLVRFESPEPVKGCSPAQMNIPDLSDPATLGCLRALVREAWGDPLMMAHFVSLRAKEVWGIRTRAIQTAMGYPKLLADGCSTEAEALVRALEAAP